MFESYAQNCEDIVLWRALKTIDAGTYVDVGAAHPDHDSVTKAFYDRGWSGLNVEPAPDLADALRRERPRDHLAQACAGATTASVVLHHVAGSGLSSVVDDVVHIREDEDFSIEDVEVSLRRLDDLLVEAGMSPSDDIHFLKIDVEGFEADVVRGIDLEVWRPWIIVIESTKPRSTEQTHEHWEGVLLDHRYQFCLFDGLNRFYVAEERGELGELLSFPAGVFDQPYLTPPHARLLREHWNLVTGYERLEATYDDVQQAYARLERELERVLAANSALEATHRDALDANARLEAVLDGCMQERSRLEASNSELSAEVTALRAGVAQMGEQFGILRGERDGLRNELDLTRQTLSWRVTRPLRSVRRLVGD